MINLIKHKVGIFKTSAINRLWPPIGTILLSITLFLLPFPRSWSNYALGVFLFSGLLGWFFDFYTILRSLTKMWILIFPPIVYFVFHLLSYLLTSANLSALERPLMFLLIPLLGFPIFLSDFFRKNIKRVLKVYIIGIFIIAVFQFIRVTFASIELTEGKLEFHPIIVYSISRFNSEYLSSFEHPTYIAMKSLWALTLVLFFKENLFSNKLMRYLLIFVLLAFIYFLSSRTGIISTILVLIILTFKNLKTLLARVIFFISMLLLVYPSYKIITLNKRINFSLTELNKRMAADSANMKNIDERTREWYSALQLIRKRPVLGYGINYLDFLVQEHNNNSFEYEAANRMNAHNQFLETQLLFGIPGIIILLWILFGPLMLEINLPNPFLYKLFLLIVVVNFFFESMLVRQWGIMFFLLFYFILSLPAKMDHTVGIKDSVMTL